MKAAAGAGYAIATRSLADWLVQALKIPFREATSHHRPAIVALAAKRGVALERLTLDECRASSRASPKTPSVGWASTARSRTSTSLRRNRARQCAEAGACLAQTARPGRTRSRLSLICSTAERCGPRRWRACRPSGLTKIISVGLAPRGVRRRGNITGSSRRSGQRVHCAALEEQQVSWGEFRLGSSQSSIQKVPRPGEDEEIFVTGRMVVRRRWLVRRGKTRGAGRPPVRQITVDQERGGRRRKAGGNGRNVETRRLSLRGLVLVGLILQTCWSLVLLTMSVLKSPEECEWDGDLRQRVLALLADLPQPRLDAIERLRRALGLRRLGAW